MNIASYCSKYSDWSQSCCQCIATKESGGNANAANYNTNGSFDVGLYQINNINWASCSGGKAPCDPNTNVKCAHLVCTCCSSCSCRSSCSWHLLVVAIRVAHVVGWRVLAQGNGAATPGSTGRRAARAAAATPSKQPLLLSCS